MHKKQAFDLTQGSTSRHMMRMLTPFWLAIMAMMSAGIVDTIYLGRLSTDALATIGFCFPILFLGSSVNIGLGAGTLSAISRAIGRKDFGEARALGASALLLSLTIMSVLSILILITMPFILDTMNIGSDIKPFALKYLVYTVPGLVVLGVAMMSNNIIRAGGEAALPSTIMITSAVANIIIDPFLIFGIGPFPRMEIEGAALATLISNFIAAGFGLFAVLYLRKSIEFANLTWARVKREWYVISRVGLPAIGTNVIVPISAYIITAIIGHTMGKTEIAAFTITGRVEMLSIALLYALSACIGVVTGQNGGAGLTDRVRGTFIFSYKICVYWALFISVVLAIFARYIPAIFTTDAQVIALAMPYFWIVPITLAGYGFVFVSAAGLNALGRPKYGLIFTLIRSLGLMLPLIWFGAHVYGMVGVYYAVAAANILSGVISILYTLKRVPMTVSVH
ncbi:MAG: hypothetical protein COA69_14120 [Robiginitomaculum sp.]|nr:MAG: hypothetical protein COA69_14120 [Robiginitomaculum sp.]